MTKKKMTIEEIMAKSEEIIGKHMQKAEAITCIGCKKTPEQIKEYELEARREDMTPTEWVKANEPIGCWGPHSRNKFYCTECYIKAGMPLRR
jgi:hypothetical protein